MNSNQDDYITHLRDQVEYLEEKVAKLKQFKEYVHDRLDDAGVPIDPEPEKNAAHGCRIEGRLNYAFNLFSDTLYGHLPRCAKCGAVEGTPCVEREHNKGTP